jgi:hypothetical protein
MIRAVSRNNVPNCVGMLRCRDVVFCLTAPANQGRNEARCLHFLGTAQARSQKTATTCNLPFFLFLLLLFFYFCFF